MSAEIGNGDKFDGDLALLKYYLVRGHIRCENFNAMSQSIERYYNDRPVVVASKISSDGLRYKEKPTGTPFTGGVACHSGAVLSCFFCGTHRTSTNRSYQLVIGRKQAVCNPPCDKNPRAKKLRALAAQDAEERR